MWVKVAYLLPVHTHIQGRRLLQSLFKHSKNILGSPVNGSLYDSQMVCGTTSSS